MILLLAAVATAQTSPSALFDACVKSLSSTPSYSVHIEVKGNIHSKKQQTTFDLAVRGRDALLRVREPATALVDKSDRTYQLVGSHLLAYDSVADERLQRTQQGKDSVGVRLASLLGTLDEALAVALEPEALRRFFEKFGGFRDWKMSQRNGLISMTRSAKGAGTLFQFNKADHSLKRIAFLLKDSSLEWAYTFRRGADLGLIIPHDARRVSSFYVREAPPKFKSAEAKDIVEHMVKAYGALRNGIIRVEADGVVSNLYLAGNRLREERAQFVWAFDGNTLTFKNKRNGKFYSGRGIGHGTRVILSEYLAKIGGEVDPIIRRLIARRVPFQELFRTDAVVKVVGSVGSGDRQSDIVEIDSPGLKVSIFVHREDHMLESIETEVVDGSRHVLSRSSRQFTYVDMGTAPDSDKFHLDAGNATILPLPDINLTGGRTN